MGMSLARNMKSKGFSVLGYDSDRDKIHEAENYQIATVGNLTEFIAKLESPRKILIMVPAGKAVDSVLQSLKPHLHSGDCVADGGNSYFKDTADRQQELAEAGVHYLGLGISGGRRGALEGPGMMAGGSHEAYDRFNPILEAISARFDDQPCVAYLGPGGAGHYVKMVHNGIEYGMMQILAEAYAVLKIESKLSNNEIAQVYRDWNRGELRGFLTKITADIFQKKDASGDYWIDQIKDAASQKGTGNWTVQNSLELGIPIPAIDAAVRQRQISAHFKERSKIMSQLKSEPPQFSGKPDHLEEELESAVYISQLLIFIQGFHLLAEARETYSFSYQLREIAEIWRSGCIISSKIVEFLSISLSDTVEHSLLNPVVSGAVRDKMDNLRTVLSLSTSYNIALPCMSACFNYWQSFSSAEMPANLIQAQRDYFGGHGLETKSGEKTSLDWDPTTS